MPTLSLYVILPFESESKKICSLLVKNKKLIKLLHILAFFTVCTVDYYKTIIIDDQNPKSVGNISMYPLKYMCMALQKIKGLLVS